MKKIKQKKTALVTGAAKRIGRELALFLAGCGFDIALHVHTSQKDAEAVARQIRSKGVRCEIFNGNLADEDETLELIQNVFRKFPSLELLINCASIFEPSKFSASQHDLKIYDDHFAINLKAPFILSAEFARLCKKGQIINMLDTNIVKNKTNHVAYLLTKKGLAEMTKLAAATFAPNIRVNGICPGLILPPKNESAQYLDRLAKRVPLGRKGHVSHLTQSVEFLLQNDYVTGQLIFNDGGENLV